tara:strand:+ start:290 stop:949 length:660 start_codon:yes stop_codon:yes gene_type:complete
MDNFSVIIRTRNEERHIGYCLQSITDYIGKPQIIIVDNESTDSTMRIVNRFEYHDIEKYTIKKNDYTPGRALNIGIDKVVNPYTLIMSAHCEIKSFDSKSVQQKLDGVLSNDLVAVWGKQIPIWDGKKITRRYMWSNFKDLSKVNYFCESEDRYFFHNAFSLFKTDYLRENLFDERHSSKEDRYWANERIEDGKKIMYDATIRVNHHYTPNGATWMGTG